VLERTVVLVSLPLTKKKVRILKRVYNVYGEILVGVVEYMWSNKVGSWLGAKRNLYWKFREKYPNVPSHYIHEAIRDASRRVKSFRKLRRRGRVRTSKPVVRRWSVGCDNQLWRLSFEGVRIATHKGWVNVPVRFPKLFWRYYNRGWVLRSSARWKLIGNRLYLYVVFTKTVKKSEVNLIKIYGIDVNENNVTIYEYPTGRARTIVTNFSKVVLGYAYRRMRIQRRWCGVLGVRNNRRLKVALRKLRERNVKKEIKLKLVRAVVNVVCDGVVVLERLSKDFLGKVIERNKRLRGLDVHRLKQSSILGVHRLIIAKLTEFGFSWVLVDPAYTSSVCPICGSKLISMTGYAQRNGWKPRLMKCPRCGFIHDRDVIGAMNLVRKYFLDVRRVPFASKGAHDPRVEWLVVAVKRGVEAQPVLARPIMT